MVVSVCISGFIVHRRISRSIGGNSCRFIEGEEKKSRKLWMGLGSSRSMRNLSFSWLSPHAVATWFVLPTPSFYITTLLNVAGRFKRSGGGQGFALFRLSLSRVGSSGFSKRMRIPVPARVTVERWLCSVPGWWAAFCETEADSRDGGPFQLDQKSSCESRRCQTNGRHVSAACRYGTNSIFQGFQ